MKSFLTEIFINTLRYRSGNILVVDTERGGTIVERLRGHNDEVHSISWCPVAGEDIHMTYAGEDDGKDRLTHWTLGDFNEIFKVIFKLIFSK